MRNHVTYKNEYTEIKNGKTKSGITNLPTYLHLLLQQIFWRPLRDNVPTLYVSYKLRDVIRINLNLKKNKF